MCCEECIGAKIVFKAKQTFLKKKSQKIAMVHEKNLRIIMVPRPRFLLFIFFSRFYSCNSSCDNHIAILIICNNGKGQSIPI